MSKNTISASAIGLPSRRLVLAAGAAAAVFGALSSAAQAEQSIASLIAAHRNAHAAFSEACKREDDLCHDKESAAYEQAEADWERLAVIEDDALTALLAFPASNPDEARAKAAYVLDAVDYEALTWDKIDAFMRSFI
jgi:hypothetical protein